MPAKNINRVLVFVMLVITMLGLAGSYIIIQGNKDMIWQYMTGGESNVRVGTPLENCKSVADRLSLEVTVDGQDLSIKRYTINNPEMLFSKVSAMLMACTQYRLDSMCIGTECAEAAFTAKMVNIE